MSIEAKMDPIGLGFRLPITKPMRLGTPNLSLITFGGYRGTRNIIEDTCADFKERASGQPDTAVRGIGYKVELPDKITYWKDVERKIEDGDGTMVVGNEINSDPILQKAGIIFKP